MRVIKPAWVDHTAEKNQRLPIYSLSVHPDGTRLATGGMDRKVKIWSTLPIIDPKVAEDEANSKLLCTMSEHTGSVLCVRWAHHGRFLASGSDDAVAMIWALDPGGGGRLWGSDEVNVENWRPLTRLVGHVADIIDLAWSRDDSMLASVGLDSKVWIWDGSTFERLRRIDAHNGFVKGVCWDPVGQYLATQSDDKTVKIWSTDTWDCVHTVSKPFEGSGHATFYRRLSWSPDGSFIAASNAKNGPVFVAQVIDRLEWDSNVSFVGHANSIQVASFSPRLFFSDPNDKSIANVSCMLALGANDFSLSIWRNTHQMPVIVLQDLFGREILDLCWSEDGLNLYGCSQDGQICAVVFEPEELTGRGEPEDVPKVLSSYDYTPARRPQRLLPAPTMTSSNGFTAPTPSSSHTVNVLKPRKPPGDNRRVIKRVDPSKSGPTLINQSNGNASRATGTGLQPPSRDPLPPPLPSGAASAFADAPLQPLDSPRQAQARRDGMFQDANHAFSNHHAGAGAGAGGENLSPRLPAKRKASMHQDDMRTPKGRTMGVSRPAMDVREIRPPRAVHASGSGGAAGAGGSGSVRLLPIPSVQSVLRTKGRGMPDESIHLEVTNAADSKGKNKVTYSQDGQDMWLDYVPAAVLGLVLTGSFAAVGCEDGGVIVYTPAGRHLFSVTLSSPIVEMSARKHWLAVITATCELYLYDTRNGGRALNPAIDIIGNLLTPTSDDNSSSNAVSSQAHVETFSIVGKGVPVLITSHPSAFIYDTRKSGFMPLITPFQISGSPLISIASSAAGASRVRGGSGAQGVVSELEQEVVELYRKATSTTAPDASTSTSPEWWDVAMTLQHLEMRMRACEVLESKEEYRNNLKEYARKIGSEGFRGRAEELVKEFMGPIYHHPERKFQWEPETIGLQKRDLAKMVLGIFGQFPALQSFAQGWQHTIKAIADEDKALHRDE